MAGKYTDSEDVALEKDLNEKKSAKEKQNYTPAKWDIDKYMESVPFVNNDKSTVNWYVLRYADVLLLYAEALNEWKGWSDNRRVCRYEKVRKRGYNGANGYKLTQGMDQAQFRESHSKRTCLRTGVRRTSPS